MEKTESKCPVCGQLTTVFRNPIRRTLSEALIYWLFELSDAWFRLKASSHYSDISLVVKTKYDRISSDYSLLLKFGLIAKDDAKAGHYLPTQRGVMFCLGKHSVSKYYLGGADYSSEQITIADVLSKPPACNWKYF